MSLPKSESQNEIKSDSCLCMHSPLSLFFLIFRTPSILPSFSLWPSQPGQPGPALRSFREHPGRAPPASCPGCPGSERPPRGPRRVRPWRPLAINPLWLRGCNSPGPVLAFSFSFSSHFCSSILRGCSAHHLLKSQT